MTATLAYSLLDETLISARGTDGRRMPLTLPGVLAALARDTIRDFPALRPHQRHPWHAFLVQLAAIALHQADEPEPFSDAQAWRSALLALTPDGAAWCLVTPPDRPALLQAPVPDGSIVAWKNRLDAPDELDMLVTSKNHDLKAARMRRAAPEDWLLALLSLQTQEGFLGSGNYGISRMNGGLGSRCAVGAVSPGGWGRRWQRDVATLLAARSGIAADFGLRDTGGIALVWLFPWSGTGSIPFSALDPFYIEICRRVRLTNGPDGIGAITTGSKCTRIDATGRNGVTGDAWLPVNVTEGKALSLSYKGFDYKLTAGLLFGGNYRRPVAQTLFAADGRQGITMLARGVTRGQGKTEGYHERRVPIAPKARAMLIRNETDRLAAIATGRIDDIGRVRTVLWTSLAALLANGEGDFPDSVKDKANRFAAAFEQYEDARFFDGRLGLNEQLEADDPEAVRVAWYQDMADRAEAILRRAFEAGPRSAERRYRARAAALGRFRAGLRKELPTLAGFLDAQRSQQPPITGESERRRADP